MTVMREGQLRIATALRSQGSFTIICNIYVHKFAEYKKILINDAIAQVRRMSFIMYTIEFTKSPEDDCYNCSLISFLDSDVIPDIEVFIQYPETSL
jgi:hypothetical protein